MLATVTNRARGARGFATPNGKTVILEAGASALLDLADHPLHRVWAASGDVLAVPLSDKDAKAARKRLDAEAEDRARGEAEALRRLAAPDRL